MFGAYLRPPFADYHADFWRWVWEIEAGQAARPFVAIWPRGFTKSTSAEIACAWFAATGARTYVLYVCSTQERADDHVQNISRMLGSTEFTKHYKTQSARGVTRFGHSEGWRRNRIHTASGFTVDALGLDTASRGTKFDDDRPDMIILDDIDDPLDSEQAVKKKITTLTQAILPAGVPYAATMVMQNLIHKDGIVSRLAGSRADFLAEREVSGPYPALTDAEYQHLDGRWQITGGVPTWPAMDYAALQATLNTIGVKAFKRELQHEVNEVEGALWTIETIDTHRLTEMPPGVKQTRVVVGVDPPAKAAGAECGIIVGARGSDKRGYVLADLSRQGSPNEWATAVIGAYDRHQADAIVIEVNQGGDMVRNTLTTIRPKLNIREVHASRNKVTRAEPISSLYEAGDVSHIGHFPALEDQQATWVPGMESPDRMDALVWTMFDLMLTGQPVVSVAAAPLKQVSQWSHG